MITVLPMGLLEDFARSGQRLFWMDVRSIAGSLALLDAEWTARAKWDVPDDGGDDP